MAVPERVDFRFGQSSLSLEVPPFFIDFEKRSFKSILVRKGTPSPEDQRVLFYIYVTRSQQMKKLLALKSIHPDIFIPKEIEDRSTGKGASAEVAKFSDSVSRLEETWPYGGNGVWLRRFGSFTLHMVLIIGEGRWTIRPAVSKESLEGFGVEIPVKVKLVEDFKEELREDELEEIHDHTTNQHFHLKVESLQRYIELAKKWDYYFSTAETWKQTVQIP